MSLRVNLYIKFLNYIIKFINKRRKYNLITKPDIMVIERLIKLYVLILIISMFLIDIRMGVPISLLLFSWLMSALFNRDYEYYIIFYKLLNKKRVSEELIYINQENSIYYEIVEGYYYKDFLNKHGIRPLEKQEAETKIFLKKEQNKLIKQQDRLEEELNKLKDNKKK